MQQIVRPAIILNTFLGKIQNEYSNSCYSFSSALILGKNIFFYILVKDPEKLHADEHLQGLMKGKNWHLFWNSWMLSTLWQHCLLLFQ